MSVEKWDKPPRCKLCKHKSRNLTDPSSPCFNCKRNKVGRTVGKLVVDPNTLKDLFE